MRKSSNDDKRILIVDDNALIASTLAQVLNFEGFNVVAAFSAKKAMALLHDGSFDILISDVMMPEMTGIELAIKALEAQYVRSVLLMSGVSGTANLLENARKLGYDFEILAKPMHPSEVIDRLHGLFDVKVRTPQSL